MAEVAISMAKVVIDCPRPPSINALWRVGRGRLYKSNTYTAWLQQFALHILEQKVHRHYIDGPFTLTTIISSNQRADLDNVAGKAILDGLQHYNVIANDRNCRRLVAEYGEAPLGCRIVLESS
jgi:Holliday junction resolvase RusA-like endonuclease